MQCFVFPSWFWYLSLQMNLEHGAPVLVARFNHDGKYCISGCKDRSIRLWNPHKGNMIKEYSGAHGYDVYDVRISLVRFTPLRCIRAACRLKHG